MNHSHIKDFKGKMSLRQPRSLQKDGWEKQKSQWTTIVSFPWSMRTVHLDNTNGRYEAKQQGCNQRHSVQLVCSSHLPSTTGAHMVLKS